MTQIRALVWKDLRVHWRAAGLLLLGWPVGVRLLVSLQQTSTDADRLALPVAVSMMSALFFVAVAAGLATMLVERERSKETFAWLRTLPVSDAHIVTGKCVTWLVFHVVGSAAWWIVLGRLGPPLTVPQAVSLWCVTAVIGSLALVSLLASSGRLAQVAPVGVLCLGLLTSLPLRQSPEAMATLIDWWHGSWGHLVVWAGCAVAYVLLVALAHVLFHAADTPALVD